MPGTVDMLMETRAAHSVVGVEIKGWAKKGDGH